MGGHRVVHRARRVRLAPHRPKRHASWGRPRPSPVPDAASRPGSLARADVHHDHRRSLRHRGVRDTNWCTCFRRRPVRAVRRHPGWRAFASSAPCRGWGRRPRARTVVSVRVSADPRFPGPQLSSECRVISDDTRGRTGVLGDKRGAVHGRQLAHQRSGSLGGYGFPGACTCSSDLASARDVARNQSGARRHRDRRVCGNLAAHGARAAGDGRHFRRAGSH